MAYELRLSTQIQGDPERIWSLIEQPSGWSRWWPDCVLAQVSGQRSIQEGAVLELVVQPVHHKWTFRPEVDLITPGRLLSLTHRSLGVQWTLRCYVQPGPRGTRVELKVDVTGPMGWIMGFPGRGQGLQASLDRLLKGLKRLAEKLV